MSALCRYCAGLAPEAALVPPARPGPPGPCTPQSFCQYRGKVQSMSPEEIENLKKCDKVGVVCFEEGEVAGMG